MAALLIEKSGLIFGFAEDERVVSASRREWRVVSCLACGEAGELR